eukprot:101041_1
MAQQVQSKNKGKDDDNQFTPFAEKNISSPLKKYASYRPRRSSEPSLKTPVIPYKLNATLDSNEMEYFEQYINEHCPELLPECTCDRCGGDDIKKDDMNMSPPSSSNISNLISPPSIIAVSHSAPFPQKQSSYTPPALTKGDSRYSITGDCEITKNLSIKKTVGIGVKNNIPRLLDILNDYNTRLLFENYKKEWKDNNDDNKDDEEEDEDDDDIEDMPVLDTFPSSTKSNEMNISLSSPSSRLMRSIRCSVLDSVPLMSTGPRTAKVWDFLRKMPIHQAIRTYHTRLVPPLTFQPRYLIKDSINHYLRQISLMTYAAQFLADQNGMPLQLDLLILSKEAVLIENDPNMHPLINPEDKQRKNSKGLIVPCKRKHYKEHKYYHPTDEISNIMERLVYLNTTKHEDHYEPFAAAIKPTTQFRDKRRKFIQKLNRLNLFSPSSQHGRYVFIIDREGHRTEVEHVKNDENPQKQRVIKIDPQLKASTIASAATGGSRGGGGGGSRKLKRRNTTTKLVNVKPKNNAKRNKKDNNIAEEEEEDEDDDKYDCLYFFQPPKPYGDVTQGVAMRESMHMNTLNYLLPAINGEHCPIGARHLCG